MIDQEAEIMTEPGTAAHIAKQLTSQEIDLLFGRSKQEWGSWMYKAGEHLVSLGLGSKQGGSIYFDTPLADEVRTFLLIAEVDPMRGRYPYADVAPERSRPSKDETWLRVAETIAQRGTCPRRQVGCVIVDTHSRVMATGYNGPASGRPHCSEGQPCPGAHFRSGEGLDKCEAIHAEQNACLLLNDPWKVDTIYITVSPCLPCVKLLLGTSAKRIVYREIYPHPDAIEWWKRAGRELIQLSKGS